MGHWSITGNVNPVLFELHAILCIACNDVNSLYCMQRCANDVTLPGRTKCFEWHLKNWPRCQYVCIWIASLRRREVKARNLGSKLPAKSQKLMVWFDAALQDSGAFDVNFANLCLSSKIDMVRRSEFTASRIIGRQCDLRMQICINLGFKSSAFSATTTAWQLWPQTSLN